MSAPGHGRAEPVPDRNPGPFLTRVGTGPDRGRQAPEAVPRKLMTSARIGGQFPGNAFLGHSLPPIKAS